MSDLIETGGEPEFYISDIVRTEVAGGGASLRLYLACEKHGHVILQFTVVASVADFAKMAKQVLNVAGGEHAALLLESPGALKTH